jgi:hypothetical protein
MEREAEENRLSREHAITMRRLDIQLKKEELLLKQEEAIKSRNHAQTMKEMELKIRELQVRWTNLLRIPIMVVMLPVYFILGIAIIIEVVRKEEPSDKIIALIK